MNLLGRIYKAIALSRWSAPPRLMINEFVANVSLEVSSGAWILDAGAGECRYASAFSHCNYVSYDMAVGDPSWNYTRISVLGDMTALPFRTESFDAILCTQMLEHVREPQLVLCEMAALLKSGGRLYLSVPFLGDPLHQEPYDFYRYTEYSLKYLLEKSGLFPVSILPIGGIGFLLCCYFWWLVIYKMSPRFAPLPKAWPLKAVRKAVRIIMTFLVRLCTAFVISCSNKGVVSEKFTYGYTVIAQRYKVSRES